MVAAEWETHGFGLYRLGRCPVGHHRLAGAGLRAPAEGPLVSAWDAIAALLALGVGVYLVVALMRPEDF